MSGFFDGKIITDNTVTEDKLSPELREKINNITGPGPGTDPLEDFTAGRRWDTAQSSPRADVYGNTEHIRLLPQSLGLGCYLVQDDLTMKKLNPQNHYQYEDGSAAKLDGSQGQYMWCWKKHYFTEWEEDNYLYWAVSSKPISGKDSQFVPAGGISALNAGVMDWETNKLCSLISMDGRYGGQKEGSNFTSQLGKPATGLTVHEFFNAARRRDPGRGLWGANYTTCYAVPRYLFVIIHGTRNVQEDFTTEKDSYGLYKGGLGPGVRTYGNYPVLPTSAGVELGDNTGISYHTLDGGETLQIPVFLGLKNIFGNLSCFVCDQRTLNGDLYVYNAINSDTPVIAVNSTTSGSGYISKISMNRLCCYPTELNGTGSTYYCDYASNGSSVSGNVRIVGGFFSDGTSAGLFSSDTLVNYVNSDKTTHVTAPLCFLHPN